MPAADLGPLYAGFAGCEAGLDEEELVEDEAPHGCLESGPLRREVDLVDGVV
jgi:hypothetical protein